MNFDIKPASHLLIKVNSVQDKPMTVEEFLMKEVTPHLYEGTTVGFITDRVQASQPMSPDLHMLEEDFKDMTNRKVGNARFVGISWLVQTFGATAFTALSEFLVKLESAGYEVSYSEFVSHIDVKGAYQSINFIRVRRPLR